MKTYKGLLIITLFLSFVFPSKSFAQDTLLINYKGRIQKFKIHQKDPADYPKLFISAGVSMDKRPYTDYILMKNLLISYNVKNRLLVKSYISNPVIDIFDNQYYDASKFSFSDNETNLFLNFGSDLNINLFNLKKETDIPVLLGRTTLNNEKIKLYTHVKTTRLYAFGFNVGGFYERNVIRHIGNYLYYDGIFQVMNHVNYNHTIVKGGLNFTIMNYVVGEIIKLKKVETIQKFEVFANYLYAVEQNLEDIVILHDFYIDHQMFNPYDDELMLAGVYPLKEGIDMNVANNGFVFGIRYQDLKYNNQGYTAELTIGSYPGVRFIDGKHDLFLQFRMTFDFGLFN